MQRGDATAFGLLYDRYGDRAYRVARLIAGDPGRAEEAVQEGFSSIWAARATYRPERPTAAAWILTVVRNRAIDAARRDAADLTRSVGDELLDGHPSLHDVAEEALARVAAAELHALLGGLPDVQREVIVLAFYGQLSQTEIAHQLDLPLGTIKARIRRGLYALRAELLKDAA
jgi:RNA polymerase sigma-70 factor (ECF subfamily)